MVDPNGTFPGRECSVKALTFIIGVISTMDHNQSPLNRTGALQGGDGEFWGIFTPFYTIKFRGGPKSGGARATVASPSLAPLIMFDIL